MNSSASRAFDWRTGNRRIDHPGLGMIGVIGRHPLITDYRLLEGGVSPELRKKPERLYSLRQLQKDTVG